MLAGRQKHLRATRDLHMIILEPVVMTSMCLAEAHPPQSGDLHVNEACTRM